MSQSDGVYPQPWREIKTKACLWPTGAPHHIAARVWQRAEGVLEVPLPPLSFPGSACRVFGSLVTVYTPHPRPTPLLRHDRQQQAATAASSAIGENHAASAWRYVTVYSTWKPFIDCSTCADCPLRMDFVMSHSFLCRRLSSEINASERGKYVESMDGALVVFYHYHWWVE